mgnify:CR=1 FL=1
MNEKTMVSDALVGVNGELKMFGEIIPQTENKELKQCLIKNSRFSPSSFSDTRDRNPECVSVRDFTFYLFTLHFSLKNLNGIFGK